MLTRTMHMGGYATGAARPGACPTLFVDADLAAPIAHKPWHKTGVTQLSAVFITDRPTRRPLERFP